MPRWPLDGSRLVAVLALVWFFSGPAQAMEPLFLQQDLDLRYDRWQQAQADSVSDTNARYNFMLQVPALSYRLGNVTFNGTLEYDRLAIGPRTDSGFGLTRYGLHAFLFPYRRFHLILDYQHATNISHFGLDPMRANSYGVEYSLNLPRYPRLRISWRQGDNSEGATRETWSQWTLDADQQRGSTSYTFNFTRQAMEFGASSGNWAVNSAYLTTSTQLATNWWFRTNADYIGVGGNDSAGASATLDGILKGWTSSTRLDFNEAWFAHKDIGNAAFSQSLSKTWDRYTLFGSAAASTVFGSAKEGEASSGKGTSFALQAGGMVLLGKEWTLLGDLSVTRDSQARFQTVAGTRALSGNVLTLHAGVAQGGTLPSYLMKPFFFVSDLAFDARVRAEYPPGYVPSELAEEIFKRRMRQLGTLQFAADYYYSRRDSGGTNQWLRVTGTLQANAHLYISVMGDYIRNEDFFVAGQRHKQVDATLNMAYNVGRYTLNAGAGYNRTDDLGSVPPVAPALMGRRTVYYTVGFTARFWKNILGLLATRYDQGDGLPTTSYTVYDTLVFRNISFRIIADRTTRPDGYRATRLSIDILRLFDTLVFGRGYR